MKRTIFFIIGSIFCMQYVFAQHAIKGKITDESGLSLANVNILIADLNKGTLSKKDGSFELTNLPSGKHKIQFSHVGYSNHLETIDLKNEDKEINIVLKSTVFEIQEIVVSGGYRSTQHENSIKIESIVLDPKKVKQSPSLMEMVAQLPGVDMISKGSGISKPVIRGLSMNNVLVLYNGVRYENYQYSDHHPLGIDEYGIEEVEVIKGPASLLYGSDAIGGVINFIKEQPAPQHSIMGDYNVQVFSNSLGIKNNLGIKGSSSKLFGGFRIGQQTHADYLQGGGDFVPNSRFNELSLKANAGYTDKKGTFTLHYDYSKSLIGIPEEEAEEIITKRGRKVEHFFQQFNTHLLSSQNKLYLGKIRVDANVAYQNTELIHGEDMDEYEIQMRLETLSYETRINLPSSKNSEYIVGFQGFNQTNTNVHDREVILLPDAQSNNYSVFGLIQQSFNSLTLQGGLRYDVKSIKTNAVGFVSDSINYRPSLQKSYGAMSGSFGATWHAFEPLFIRANIATAYRTPNLPELSSKGVHELRYELGDANLRPMQSVESDLSVHYHLKQFTFDVAGFYNDVSRFIYIAPTGDTTNDGLHIYQYRQFDAYLYGGETGIHFHPTTMNWLHIEGNHAMVIGKRKNGENLPFIPAQKVRLEFRGQKDKWWKFNKLFVLLVAQYAFKQDRVAPEEEPTSSYALFDANIGFYVPVQQQELTFMISVNNLFDKKYIDHLSTLKETPFYNAGRNVVLTLKIPFGLRKS